MVKLQTDNKGQALLLIIIVLFIVFFLVVSVSENISVDNLNTIENQNFQKAFVAANSALSAAKKDILSANPQITQPLSKNCNYGTGALYQCQYVIKPQTEINQLVQKDQAVQAYVLHATNATVKYNDDTSLLILNLINANNTNIMCLYYPTTLNIPISQADLSKFQYSNAACGNGGSLKLTKQSDGYYTVTIPNPGAWQFLRASIFNYSNNPSTIVISPDVADTDLQQYEIIATGFAAGSRRTIHSYLSVYGTPPGIFDYALFNGGNGAQINF